MATKGKRVKVEGTVLQTWEEANEALKQYGLLELQKAEFDAELHRTVTDAKAKAEAEVKPVAARMAELERQIREFVEEHRADMEPTKSRALTFGKVGFRISTRLKFIGTVKDTLDALKRLGMVGCIRVKEEPDKEALREYSDGILESVHVRRVQDDEFFFEPDREVIKELPR